MNNLQNKPQQHVSMPGCLVAAPRIGSLLLALLFVGAVSCHGEGNEGGHAEHLHSKHKHSSIAGMEQLRLNAGMKWKMDAHTRKSIQSMSDYLKKARMKQKDLEALRQTGASLEHEMQALIKGCTMTGESHKQLHLILPELQEAINGLHKASALSKAQASLQELEALMAKYHKYFE